VDAAASNFGEGVSVQVMRVGVPWALQALRDYEPANKPPPEKDREWRDTPITCPKCRSEEVVFEQLTRESAGATDESKAKFAWTCDSCGYQWADEGERVNEC
jgi:DNA-directed RNA polymerase subunit M/transcription elongation factor TFIIS